MLANAPFSAIYYMGYTQLQERLGHLAGPSTPTFAINFVSGVLGRVQPRMQACTHAMNQHPCGCCSIYIQRPFPTTSPVPHQRRHRCSSNSNGAHATCRCGARTDAAQPCIHSRTTLSPVPCACRGHFPARGCPCIADGIWPTRRQENPADGTGVDHV